MVGFFRSKVQAISSNLKISIKELGLNDSESSFAPLTSQAFTEARGTTRKFCFNSCCAIISACLASYKARYKRL
jgi:hypothetical protein